MRKKPLPTGRRGSSVQRFLAKMTWRPLELRQPETGKPRDYAKRPSEGRPSRMPAPDAARNRALIEADRTKREARRARSTKNTPYAG